MENNDFNNLIISGVIEGVPTLTNSEKGRVVKFMLKSKQDISDTQPHTEWYSVVCPPPASAIAAHLVADKRVMLIGSLRSKDGGAAKSVLAYDIQLLA